MYNRKKLAAIAAISIGQAFTAGPVLAQEAAEEKSYRLAVGAGVYAVLDPYNGNKEEPQTGPLPYFVFENAWLTIDPTALALRPVSTDHFAVEALVGPRWLLADPADTERHKGIERETGIDAGARISGFYDRFKLSLEYRGDVSGRSNGHELTAALGGSFDVSDRFNLSVEGGAYWRDDDLSTYLFGVLPDEATSTRPAYRLKETITPFAGAMATYRITNRISAVVAGQAEFFGDKITASPIVERELTASAFAALTYDF